MLGTLLAIFLVVALVLLFVKAAFSIPFWIVVVIVLFLLFRNRNNTI
jgi:hypothetical protein